MDNPYIPKVVRVERISKETPDIKTVSLKYQVDFIPGQFLQVSCFGAGEAPISISSGPHEGFLKVTFKRVGSVTGSLFNIKKNDAIGLRGPFGNGFDLKQVEGKNLILIAGGVGLAPIRSLIKFILHREKHRFSGITLLYGSRAPGDMLYKKELKEWAKHMNVLLTVDSAPRLWKGRLGVVPKLLNEITVDPLTTKAVLCGPPLMMRFTTAKLLELGMKPSDIILSLERHMECGIGKCGHCYVGEKFVCTSGPVFTRKELDEIVPGEIL